MNFTQTRRVRAKFVSYPPIDSGFTSDPSIYCTMDLDQDSDKEVAELAKLRDKITEILNTIMPGSQEPIPDEEVPLVTEHIARWHRVLSLARPELPPDKAF